MEAGVGLGQREGDALVLADRVAVDDPLVGVGHRPLDGDAADADRLGGDEDALGVEAVEQVGEAAALLPHPVVDRHPRSSNTTSQDTTALRPVLGIGRDRDVGDLEVGEQQGEAVGLARRPPRAAWCARAAGSSGSTAPWSSRPCDPARRSGRRRAEPRVVIARGVGARVGLGDAEGDVELPGHDVGQVALAQLVGCRASRPGSSRTSTCAGRCSRSSRRRRRPPPRGRSTPR